jgi:phospholipid transport system transporter-binding protein
MPAAEAASLERAGETLRFTGALLRDGVPGLWRQALPLLGGMQRFDLTAVTRVDSAGVALLAELAARTAGVPIIDGAPAGLAELRAAYRLQPDLGFA